MQQVTIRYGIDSISKTFTIPVTVAQIKRDSSIKAALGFGDNIRVLQNGVELPDETVLPNGATIVVETRSNQKAS